MKIYMRLLELQTRNGAISDNVEGSPASKSDLVEGDVIVSFEGKEISNGSNLKTLYPVLIQVQESSLVFTEIIKRKIYMLLLKKEKIW